jgi:hypothetical protein
MGRTGCAVPRAKCETAGTPVQRDSNLQPHQGIERTPKRTTSSAMPDRQGIVKTGNCRTMPWECGARSDLHSACTCWEPRDR